MNEVRERTVVIDLYLRRRTAMVLILALLTICFAAHLVWGETGTSSADAKDGRLSLAAASSSMRQFYLTNGTHTGANADGACEPGYHMASLWEILDPSSLTYNAHLGMTDMDSGQGPPSDPAGWIRTGGSTTGGIAGYANCQGYTTNAPAEQGTTVWLDTTWDGTPAAIHVWEAATWSCGLPSRVWCVEDSVFSHIFLPLVARST